MPSPTCEMPTRETLRPGSAHRLLPLTAPRLPDPLRERIRYLHYSRSTKDIRAVRELLGHSDVASTTLNIHALNVGGGAVRSTLDSLPKPDGPRSVHW